jgi:CubicO group peptidase (beta-lactamase class C family)
MPLEFSPGTRWNYSVSTDVVGHLIELISGQSLDDYLREHVFEPLDMRDTSFAVSDGQVPRLTANYERGADGALRLSDDPEQSQFRERSFFSGGGGLVSTAPDYYRFCAMMGNRGELDGVRLLGRKTVELMTTNHLPGGRDLTDLAQPGMFTETPYAGVGFGLGVSVMQSPARAHILGSAGEYAWGGAASTAFWIDPAEDLVVIFMTQVMPASSYPLRRELRTMTYAALID